MALKVVSSQRWSWCSSRFTSLAHPSSIISRFWSVRRKTDLKSSPFIALAVCVSVAPLFADKLTDEDRMEILRGLTAEYATVKLTLPRSKKPLVFNSNGTWDKVAWEDARRRFGPAARLGDLVQITNVTIESDKLLLEINHGVHDKGKWYQRIEIGGGPTMTP